MLIRDKEIYFGQYQFNAEEEDEIGFKVGEPIILIEKDEKYNDGWWKGMKFNGTVGIFPSNYVVDKNIKNVDVEKLLNYRENSLNKKSIKLKSPPKPIILTDDIESSKQLSAKSPKSPKTPKTPKTPKSPKSPKSPSKVSTEKSPKKSPAPLIIDHSDNIATSPKKAKSPKKTNSPKKETFTYDDISDPKSPNAVYNPKSPNKVVMSFYTGQESSCHGSIVHSSSDEQLVSDSLISPLPQENNDEDSSALPRKNSKKLSRRSGNIFINTKPILYNSSNAPKSPYLLRTPHSAYKSPYLTHSGSPKYNSFTPKSATAKSPYLQMKSCLKHRSISVPSTPIKNNKNVPMINTINIKPNIATMEIESGISGASSLFSPNRTTKYLDDFMLDDNDPENPRNWSVEEVSDWLYSIGYVSASKFFREKKVNGEMLVQMNLPTLREIGVSTLSERITLLHSILSLKEEYSSKCFEEMMYSGSVTVEELESPTKQSTIDGNYYQIEMNNMYEKALKNPNLDDEKKKKIKKMMSTFTVSDYLSESPNHDPESMHLQNQLLKKQQLQNKQFGREQLTLSQYNNIYNVSPQHYNISDQYRRNVPILNTDPNQDNYTGRPNNKSLMLSAKKLVKGRNNNIYINESPLVNESNDIMNDSTNIPKSNSSVNPLYLMNNSNSLHVDLNQYQDNENENENEEKSKKNSGNFSEKSNNNELVSPKSKSKKHKYLNQYHDFNFATRQGWLNVKYGTFKIWKKRWAILVYDTLYLLKDQYINNEKPPRIVLVLQITPNNSIDSDKQDAKKFNFKIKDPKLGTIHFAADSQLSMITWVNLFVRIITSNPIKEIQLYPLKDQNVSNNTFMMNSSINNVEIGKHFQINKNEKYQDFQKQDRKSYEDDGNNNAGYNDENIEEYNTQTLNEVNALQEKFNAMRCNIYSMSTIGNDSNNNSPISNNNSILISPSSQQNQLVQQQLQQQYKQLLQQQQQQLITQQQQQKHQLQMKKRSNDLTINTQFNSDGTLKKGKQSNSVMFDLSEKDNGLTLNTNVLSAEQTLLSGETTSARNTISNRNDIFSPSSRNHMSTRSSNSNNSAVQANYVPPVDYNSRMSLYTPVTNPERQSYYNYSPYTPENNNYKYTSQDNRLSDITIDPYTELRKYNYLSIVPRSAESLDEDLAESLNDESYLSNIPQSKEKTYA